MTVELIIIQACCWLSLVSLCWNIWQTAQFWKAMNQREEMARAISEEAIRRAKAGDVITYYHLFEELHKVRIAQHTFALACFRNPYKLYPPYIRRLVNK